MPLFPKQKEFLKDFKKKTHLYMLYGGAVGGGKSILQIGILHQMACDYPKTKYAIVRKNLTTLKKTSLPTYKKVLELNGDTKKISINYSDYVAKYANESEIHFIDADVTKDPDFNKLKGLELTMALIEEANEVHENAFTILKTRVGRWNNTLHDIRPYIFLNCNPAKNWVKGMFYDKWHELTIKAPYYYLPALPTDNPHNSDDYINALKTLPEPEYNRYVLGNWEFADDPNQLIHYAWLREVVHNDVWEYKSRDDIIDLYLGVDVARYGDDKTELVYMRSNKIVKYETYTKKSTTDIGRIVAQRIDEYRIDPGKVGVDIVGLGAGTYDFLTDKGHSVYAFNAGESPNTRQDFVVYKNKRAEAHWQFREDVRLENIEILENKELFNDSSNIRYNIDDKVIKIEPKDEFKKRMGHSPDVLDACVICNYMRKNNNISFSGLYSSSTPNTMFSTMREY